MTKISALPVATSPLTGAELVPVSQAGQTRQTTVALVSAGVFGTWTPVITAVVPGDIAVTYTLQRGVYQKTNLQVRAWFEVNTNTFTWTTASGELKITGLPFVADLSTITVWRGTMSGFQGFVSASFSFMGNKIDNVDASAVRVLKSGSGQTYTGILIGDFPSGGVIRLIGEITYTATS